MGQIMEESNQGLWVDVSLTISSAFLLALTLGTTAYASPQPANSGDTCSMSLKTLQFAGTFDWKNAHTGKTEKLRFMIGTPEKGAAKGTSVAQIWSGKHCQASCSSIDIVGRPGALEMDEASIPISLDLQCRGEALGALAARVAVLWSHGSQPTTTLRFGSWVDGYEQAALKVEVDRFNSKALSWNTPTQAAPRLASDR
jgi:hypothetical protein